MDNIYWPDPYGAPTPARQPMEPAEWRGLIGGPYYRPAQPANIPLHQQGMTQNLHCIRVPPCRFIFSSVQFVVCCSCGSRHIVPFLFLSRTLPPSLSFLPLLPLLSSVALRNFIRPPHFLLPPSPPPSHPPSSHNSFTLQFF